VAKKPPQALEELPPADKPEGNVLWISGYWAWDDDRSDFLWVSGIWRKSPPGREWVAGYWREEGDQWQWVPGFWTSATKAAAGEEAPNKEITYLPAPPAAPATAPPGRPPAENTFYVPGTWVWTGTSYAWRAGFWTEVQPNFVWVPDHYRWTPSGYVYIPGYWDYTLNRRGILYAPVVVDPVVVTTRFYYTPAYAVSDTVIVDALFVRPCTTHYYFGDYYGPTYVALGYESGYVYSRRRYDSIVVYETWHHREEPNWVGIQVDIFSRRSDGRLPTPPRTLVQQNTIIQNTIINNNTTIINNNTTTRTVNNFTTPVVAPATQVAAAQGIKTTTIDNNTRIQARQQAVAVQQVAAQRTQTEQPLPPGAPRQARVASFSVPQTRPVQPGFTAPAVPRVSGAPSTPRMTTVPAGTASNAHNSTVASPSARPVSSPPSGWSGPSGSSTTAGHTGATPTATTPRGTTATGTGAMSPNSGTVGPTTTRPVSPTNRPPMTNRTPPRPSDTNRKPPPKDQHDKSQNR
jgi:hypothetical protein